MNNGTKRVLMGLAGLASIWAGCAVGLSVRQQKLIFNPIRIPEVKRPRSKGHRTRAVVIHSDDGTRLSGWLLTPNVHMAQGAVIYFGGRSEEVSWVVQDAGRLFPGMTVLVMNYRGYGDSHGVPGERQMIEDGKFLFDWLVRSRDDVDPHNIAVVGRSLGSGVAVQVAVQRPAAAVVLITPYDSVLAVASRRFRVMPVSLLLRHRFESIKYARNITAPVLVLRAAIDSVVPHFHTELLVAKLGGKVYDETIPESDHCSIPYLEATQTSIAGFLKQVLSRPAAIEEDTLPASVEEMVAATADMPAGLPAEAANDAAPVQVTGVLHSAELPPAIEPPIPEKLV